jgi:hypothetical protein
MSAVQLRLDGGGSAPRPAPGLPDVKGGMFPLHRLPNICCSTGDCREVDYWPMGYPQEGWLQLDPVDKAAAPVDLIAFSSLCVAVILLAETPLQQGARALLLTQAHGAGIRHRPVRCCWHRPHPQDPQRQCAGLRFASNNQP